MKTLQGKAFWRRKRAVLENQRVAIENRVEIPSEPKKTETLWSYACSGFSEIRPKIDPKSTQIEKVEKSLWSYACNGFSCFLSEIEPDRVSKKVAPELRLSRFQSLRGPTGTWKA